MFPFKKKNFKTISPVEAAELIRSRLPYILDVRTSEEYAEGHIAKAVLLSVNILSQKIISLAEYKNRPILVYCASGARSLSASKILADNEFTEIYNLEGGITGWCKAGFQIEK